MKRTTIKKARISSCIATLTIAVVAFACIPGALAETDPADKVIAVNRLTSGSWKITFGKGWSIVRVFDKDGTFWSPGRPDETGRWIISKNMILQTYSLGDNRVESLTLPLSADALAGTSRNGDTMTAVHDKDIPAATPAQPLTPQQKAATAALLTAGRWQITELDWTQAHFCHFGKKRRVARRRETQSARPVDARRKHHHPHIPRWPQRIPPVASRSKRLRLLR